MSTNASTMSKPNVAPSSLKDILKKMSNDHVQMLAVRINAIFESLPTSEIMTGDKKDEAFNYVLAYLTKSYITDFLKTCSLTNVEIARRVDMQMETDKRTGRSALLIEAGIEKEDGADEEAVDPREVLREIMDALEAEKERTSEESRIKQLCEKPVRSSEDEVQEQAKEAKQQTTGKTQFTFWITENKNNSLFIDDSEFVMYTSSEDATDGQYYGSLREINKEFNNKERVCFDAIRDYHELGTKEEMLTIVKIMGQFGHILNLDECVLSTDILDEIEASFDEGQKINGSNRFDLADKVVEDVPEDEDEDDLDLDELINQRIAKESQFDEEPGEPEVQEESKEPEEKEEPSGPKPKKASKKSTAKDAEVKEEATHLDVMEMMDKISSPHGRSKDRNSITLLAKFIASKGLTDDLKNFLVAECS